MFLALKSAAKKNGHMTVQLAFQKPESAGNIEILHSGSMQERRSSDNSLRSLISEADLIYHPSFADNSEIWFLPEDNDTGISLPEVALPLCPVTMQARAMIGDAEYFASVENSSDNRFTVKYKLKARITLL